MAGPAIPDPVHPTGTPVPAVPADADAVKLVCFDLGGVVLRICRTWADGCVAAGLERRGDVDAILSRGPAFAELNDAYQCGRIDVDAFTTRLGDLLGGLYTPAEILRVHLAWTLEEYDGVDAVVARLHDAGLETAVLSNTCHEHWETLLRYPAVDRLRNRHASHLLSLRKPDHAAYRAVESATGRRGAEILFFDDLPENVDAAREIGWGAVRIDPHGEPARQMTRVLEERGVLRPPPSS